MGAKTLTSWSFSRYSDYVQCPFKAKLKHLDRIKEPGNEAMQRGADIGKKAELYVKGEGRVLPPELLKFAPLFRDLRKRYKKKLHGMTVEDTWAFTNAWDQTTWNDWVNCWVRIKLDLAYPEDDETLIVIDWKTGKFREEKNAEYMEQLELYALGALLMHPHVQTVRPYLKYLDIGITYPPEGKDVEYTRADIPKLQKTWAKRTKKMLSDTRFAPRPNNLCKWCHYRKDNAANGGGQCKF